MEKQCRGTVFPRGGGCVFLLQNQAHCLWEKIYTQARFSLGETNAYIFRTSFSYSVLYTGKRICIVRGEDPLNQTPAPLAAAKVGEFCNTPHLPKSHWLFELLWRIKDRKPVYQNESFGVLKI